MSEGNGAAASDPGLQLIKEAFEDAQYLSIEAKDAAHMIQLGAHREQEIPDQVIMSIYGTLTEGKKAQIEFQSKSGNGYVAHIESYSDMILFMQGNMPVVRLEPGIKL